MEKGVYVNDEETKRARMLIYRMLFAIIERGDGQYNGVGNTEFDLPIVDRCEDGD